MEPAEPRGPEIGRKPDLLYRQIRDIHVQDGRMTSSAFKPATSDQDLLSVNASWKATAKEAMEMARAKNLNPVAVYAVTCEECYQQELKAWEDPEREPFMDLSHCVIDFRGYGRKTQETKGKKLRKLALERGCICPDGVNLTVA